MTKGAKYTLIAIAALFIAGAIGGWTWIIKDKDRARIEAEEAAESQAAAEAAILAEMASSSQAEKVYNTAPIQPLPQKSVSSAAGKEPLTTEPPTTDGQNTGDASKPDLEPPPPPESSDEDNAETDISPESKAEQTASSKAESQVSSSKDSSSSATSKQESTASSKAESQAASSKDPSSKTDSSSSKTNNTAKPGDRKTIDGKEYVYVDGFGWCPVTGGKTIDAPDMKENGNKIGQMG